VIGYFDVKTSPVYFHAQRTSSFWTLKTAIPFDLLRINIGNAMSTSGIFVAPKSGKYYYAYSGISETKTIAIVELQVLKSETADWSKVGEGYATPQYQTFSMQATLELAKGNQIRLRLLEGALRDHAAHYTNFVGHLLEEDIIQ
jgi:hypothetical protein